MNQHRPPSRTSATTAPASFASAKLRRRIAHPVFLLLNALLTALPLTASATIYCVDTASNSVLSLCTAAVGDCSVRGAVAAGNASAEGSVVDIRIPSGTYPIPNGLQFQPDGDHDNKTFSLTGGWNATCTSRSTNPASTILDADDGSFGGDLNFSGDQHSYVIEGLSFRNFGSFKLLEYFCGAFQICPDTDLVRIRDNHFDQGTYLWVHSDDAHTFSFSNNLVTHLSYAADPVLLEYDNNESGPGFANNTFADIDCGGSGHSAVNIRSEINGTRIHHNIFQSTSCSADLHLTLTGMVLTNNLYQSRSGQNPSSSSGNVISSNPGFIDAAGGDYHLKESAPLSPAINAGLSPLAAAGLGIAFPSQDLDGPTGKRVIGQHIDIGAFESSIDDSSVITVTNTDDSGAGSLRDAILSANSAGGSQSIHFDIPGGCPHIIQLAAPLPDITDTLEIDGYSQPGASANTLDTGSDAELCVALIAQSGTLAQFLQVPQAAASTTSLTVKGIAFAGGVFLSGNATVALRLRGGSNHLIQGNAFGGTGPGSIGDLGQPIFGIQIRNNAENVLVGGPLPEHRNSFGSMSSSAIVINDSSSGDATPHTIQNNYFGLSASGASAKPIGLNGIYASGSPNVRIYDNVFAAIPDYPAIAITGASASGYEITGNRIGMSAYNVPTTAFRVDSGIRISNGSGGHNIGNLYSSSQSNTIANTDGPGVWIDASAGTGTLVRSNRIFNTGNGGSGLAIDIGNLGVLSNDAGDADSGANDGQNWPQVTASIDNLNGSRDITVTLDSSASTNYRIDVYRSPTCAGGNRGGDLYQSVLNAQGTSDGGGHLVINDTISNSGGPAYLTAIATDLLTGSTSEISPCFDEALNLVPEVFVDGFE